MLLIFVSVPLVGGAKQQQQKYQKSPHIIYFSLQFNPIDSIVHVNVYKNNKKENIERPMLSAISMRRCLALTNQ